MQDYHGIRIEFNVLESIPFSCPNRDDANMPKMMTIGGTVRSRISSQCTKRNVRMALRNLGISIGIRTRRIEELILSNMPDDISEEQRALVKAIANTLNGSSDGGDDDDARKESKGAVLFLSREEAEALAEYAMAAADPAATAALPQKKLQNEIKACLDKVYPKRNREALDALDIALFGRMMANCGNLDVEGASFFAHAYTTHERQMIPDFFSTVDDLENGLDGGGSAFLSTNMFTSGVFYQYIVLDLGILQDVLGGPEDVAEAADAFILALYSARYPARSHSAAAFCTWDYASVSIRRGQPVQVAWDVPVKADPEGGFLQPSIRILRDKIASKKRLAGSTYGEIASFEYGEGYEDIDGIRSGIAKVLEEAD